MEPGVWVPLDDYYQMNLESPAPNLAHYVGCKPLVSALDPPEAGRLYGVIF
jgi:hypothetical protein